jgi:hypothetical protein
MGEPGDTNPAAAGRHRTIVALQRLERAVMDLEQAADAHGQRRSDEADRSCEMQAEAEALRSLQHLLSDRLDAAIARLKAGVGE